mmetsp:Transcript_98057/g.218676  ORF Transcript_98057/g.218676 Transcript_98057/m.218676 type:complete len:181 (-) Transcript_98057:13-555(-)
MTRCSVIMPALKPRWCRVAVARAVAVLLALWLFGETRDHLVQAYTLPSAAELVPKSPEMLARVALVKTTLGNRLLTPEEASILVENGAILVDVRTPMQVRKMTDGQVASGATVDAVDNWVAADAAPAAMLDRKVVVMCTASPKSTLAWEFLRAKGVDAYVIDGGFKAWAAASLPTEVLES